MPTTATEKRAIASPDSAFEQAMASLAHSYLADRAPKLLDYEVGFQLLDRNEEGDRAVGVFAFKVGKTWLYAPVVFADGDLKGHELLYVKNQDMFVPLSEDWVNYLIGKKPTVLGQGIDRNLFQRGVRHPDFRPFSQSPTKFASLLDDDTDDNDTNNVPKVPAFAERWQPWAKRAMVRFAKALTVDPTADWPISIPRFLEKEGIAGLDMLCKVAETYPPIAEKIVEFYPDNALAPVMQKAAKHIAERRGTQKVAAVTSVLPAAPDDHPCKAGRLAIFRQRDGQPAPLTFNDAESARLYADGYVIFDKRAEEEISKAYAVDTLIDHGSVITNPTETGIYDVIVKPGGVEKCVVLMYPHGPKGKCNFCVVFPTSGEKETLNISPKRL